MRSLTHLALVAALSTGLAMPSVARAEEPDPELLYKQGQADYANGLFESAIAKMDEAYRISDDPLMLYYIGQTYRDWYDQSQDVAHLREAKITFEKFIVALQADPTLGDPADVQPELDTIEAMIAEAEAAEAEPEPEPEPEPPPLPEPDPGKGQKIAGAVLLSTGGALLIGGAAVGIPFGLKGATLTDDIKDLRSEQDNANCDSASPSTKCTDLESDIDGVLDDGKRANLLTGVGLGLAGVGAILAITGGVVFAKGKRKTAVWRAEHAHFQILPTFGGIAISGRF